MLPGVGRSGPALPYTRQAGQYDDSRSVVSGSEEPMVDGVEDVFPVRERPVFGQMDQARGLRSTVPAAIMTKLRARSATLTQVVDALPTSTPKKEAVTPNAAIAQPIPSQRSFPFSSRGKTNLRLRSPSQLIASNHAPTPVAPSSGQRQ